MTLLSVNPSAELEERLRFETLLADLSSKFVNLSDAEVDRELTDAQRRICELEEPSVRFQDPRSEHSAVLIQYQDKRCRNDET